MNHFISTIAIASVLAVVATSNAVAQDSNIRMTSPSIDGYSPVSYFTEGRAERGSPEYAVQHDGKTYYLTSEAQRKTFAENPDKYRPRHRACSYSLAYGMVLPLDPENFKIIGDTLLLFHRSEEKDALLEWNSSELSEEELIRRADANLFLVTF